MNDWEILCTNILLMSYCCIERTFTYPKPTTSTRYSRSVLRLSGTMSEDRFEFPPRKGCKRGSPRTIAGLQAVWIKRGPQTQMVPYSSLWMQPGEELEKGCVWFSCAGKAVCDATRKVVFLYKGGKIKRLLLKGW